MSPESVEPASARVLVVEDDPHLRRAVGALLSVEGHVVFSAGTAAGARALLTAQPVELVLMDSGLLAGGGCRAYRGQGPATVLLMLAQGGPEARAAALEAGADDVLAKPFGPAELRRRIKAALHRGASLSPDDLALAAGLFRRLAPEAAPPSPKQLALLACFQRYPGLALAPAALLAEIWGPDYASEDGYFAAYFGELRRILGNPSVLQRDERSGFVTYAPPDSSAAPVADGRQAR